MLQIISEWLANIIFGKTSENREIEVYGFKLLISSGFSQISILVLGLMIGKFIDSIEFLVFFSILRICIGGYHSKSYIGCFILSLITFTTCIIICDLLYFILLDVYFQVSLFVVSIFLIHLSKTKQATSYHNNMGYWALIIEIIGFYMFYYFFFWKSTIVFIPSLIAVDIFLLLSIKDYY